MLKRLVLGLVFNIGTNRSIDRRLCVQEPSEPLKHCEKKTERITSKEIVYIYLLVETREVKVAAGLNVGENSTQKFLRAKIKLDISIKKDFSF